MPSTLHGSNRFSAPVLILLIGVNPPAPFLLLQVRQSFASSLRNLGTDYIDSLVLHSPMRTHDQSMTGALTDSGAFFVDYNSHVWENMSVV